LNTTDTESTALIDEVVL